MAFGEGPDVQEGKREVGLDEFVARDLALSRAGRCLRAIHAAWVQRTFDDLAEYAASQGPISISILLMDTLCEMDLADDAISPRR